MHDIKQRFPGIAICDVCGRPWELYRGAFCRPGAVAVYATPPTGNGRPKSPPERSGTRPPSESEHPLQPEAKAP